MTTSTSEKKKLEEAQHATRKPVVNQRKIQRNLKKTNSQSKNQEWFCIACLDKYSNSAPGKFWVQCRVRNAWAHEASTAAGEKLHL